MQPAYGEDQDQDLFGDEANEGYNDYGASEEQGDIDDVPVTQEDAWAVIS